MPENQVVVGTEPIHLPNDSSVYQYLLLFLCQVALYPVCQHTSICQLLCGTVWGCSIPHGHMLECTGPAAVEGPHHGATLLELIPSYKPSNTDTLM